MVLVPADQYDAIYRQTDRLDEYEPRPAPRPLPRHKTQQQIQQQQEPKQPPVQTIRNYNKVSYCRSVLSSANKSQNKPARKKLSQMSWIEIDHDLFYMLWAPSGDDNSCPGV